MKWRRSIGFLQTFAELRNIAFSVVFTERPVTGDRLHHDRRGFLVEQCFYGWMELLQDYVLVNKNRLVHSTTVLGH